LDLALALSTFILDYQASLITLKVYNSDYLR